MIIQLNVMENTAVLKQDHELGDQSKGETYIIHKVKGNPKISATKISKELKKRLEDYVQWRNCSKKT